MNNAELDYLAKSILRLRTIEEIKNFLKDLFSPKELDSIILRIQIAKFLAKNKTYLEIQRETGASPTTISKINQSLKYGNDGLKLAIERLKK